MKITVFLRRVLDRWERSVDDYARSPWSSLSVWLYGIMWLIVEKGNIGWDGWGTLIALEIAMSIRRWQGRDDR